MKHINIEVKAKYSNQEQIKNILRSRNAIFVGTDHQVDTYFKVNHGRLKLREGDIENYLIFYEREDRMGPKQSKVILFKTETDQTLKNILIKSLGVSVVVDKRREIYFIDNVKFHIDNVKNLGSFIEIEAIDEDGFFGIGKLLNQCQYYLELFEIPENDLVDSSYSDLLVQN